MISSRRVDDRESGSHEPRPGDSRLAPDVGSEQGRESSAVAKLAWYKRFPENALQGMMELTLEQRGAYNTVLDLIYSTGDRLRDDDRLLSVWCRCDIRVWRRCKARLFELGKLTSIDGFLRNARASNSVAEVLGSADFRAKSAELTGEVPRTSAISSGEVRRTSRKKSNEINGHSPELPGLRARATQNLEDRREESVTIPTMGLSPRETQARAHVNGTRQALITEAWEPSKEAIAKLRRGRPDLVGKSYDERMQDFREWCSAKAVMSHNFESSWSSFMRKDRFGGARAGGGRPGRSVDELEASSKAARERARKFEMED